MLRFNGSKSTFGGCDLYKITLFLVVAGAGLHASAGTITEILNSTGSLSPLPPITYQETVTYDPAQPINLGVISESGGDCFFSGGCDLGDFSLQFPQIVAPAGYSLTSAQIYVSSNPQFLTTGLQLVSLTPIISGQPYSAANPGSHYNSYCTDVPSVSSFGLDCGGNGPRDYTSVVADALQSSNGVLAPLTGDFTVLYGFKTGLSSGGGLNDVSTFWNTFSVTGSAPEATLVLTFDTPEPSTKSLLAFGGLLLVGHRLFRTRRAV